MKKLFTALCILGTTALLSACATPEEATTYDSGASYATDRTAGETNTAPVKVERVFKASQAK